MSYIAPTEAFIEEFCSEPEASLIAMSEHNAAQQTIILRNEWGDDIDYQDSENIKKARKIVQKMNKINESFDIRDGSGNVLTNIYARIFNKDMKHGGRFFRSDALRVKNKDNKARLDITINRKPVLEIDFRNLHFRIAAIVEGCNDQDLPLDVYMDILPEEQQDDVHRELIKLAINILFNSKSEGKAEQAIQGEINKIKNRLHPSFHSASFVKFLIYQATPDFIQCYCRQDSFGLALQNADSWLAQRVIEKFIEKGRPILPIHDSFIVDRDDVGLLIDAMGDGFREEFEVDFNVQLKMSFKEDGNVVEEMILG